MKLTCFFDASFRKESKEGIIAVLIKNEQDKTILKSVKSIECSSSIEAEYRALNKLLGNLVDKQAKDVIPKGIHITILGDCKPVIETVLRNREIKGVEKNIIRGLLKNSRELQITNNFELIWIPRRFNRAHGETKIENDYFRKRRSSLF